MNNTAFTKQWLKLESDTVYYWHLLQTLSESQLKYKPAPDKWSMLQIMEHLAGAEQSSLLYMIKKNYTPLSSRSFLPASVRSVLLNLALRSPLKFKAPNIEGLQPPNTTPPEQLLQQWQKMRKRMALYLEQAPPAVTEKPLFRHPFAGALTLPQMLIFMSDHLEHHKRQVKALLAHKQAG